MMTSVVFHFALSPKAEKVFGLKGYTNVYNVKRNNDKENVIVVIVFPYIGPRATSS